MSPFTILMLIFSGALLLYAALLAITKDYNLLPYRATNSVKPKNPEKYTFQLAKAVALTAVAPAACGIVGRWSGVGAGITFVVMLVGTLWLSTKIVKDEE